MDLCCPDSRGGGNQRGFCLVGPEVRKKVEGRGRTSWWKRTLGRELQPTGLKKGVWEKIKKKIKHRREVTHQKGANRRKTEVLNHFNTWGNRWGCLGRGEGSTNRRHNKARSWGHGSLGGGKSQEIGVGAPDKHTEND